MDDIRNWPGIRKCNAYLLMQLEDEPQKNDYGMFIRAEHGTGDARARANALGVEINTYVQAAEILTARNVTREQIRKLLAEKWVVRLEVDRPMFIR